MRKIIIGIILLGFTLVPLVSLAETTDDRWVWIDSDNRMSLFFDSESIAPSKHYSDVLDFEDSEKIFVVWVKIQYTPDYAQKVVEESNLDKDKYKDLSYDMVQWRVAINSKKLAVMSHAYYAVDGRAIGSYSVDRFSAEWTAVIPDTIGETILEKTKEYYLLNNNDERILFKTKQREEQRKIELLKLF